MGTHLVRSRQEVYCWGTLGWGFREILLWGLEVGDSSGEVWDMFGDGGSTKNALLTTCTWAHRQDTHRTTCHRVRDSQPYYFEVAVLLMQIYKHRELVDPFGPFLRLNEIPPFPGMTHFDPRAQGDNPWILTRVLSVVSRLEKITYFGLPISGR